MTARLSLLDSSGQESPWDESEQSHPDDQHLVPGDKSYDPSLRGSQHSIKISAPQEIYLQGGQSNPFAPAVVVQPSDAPPNDSSGFDPMYGQSRLDSDAGVQAPSAISTASSATSHELIDLDAPDPLAVGARSERAASSAYSSEAEAKGEKALSDPQTSQPALSMLQHTGEGTQVQKSPAPSTNLSATDAAKQKQQRSETYSIRQINWMDRTGQLLQSPILVQNQNGPCPLLALINALVLRADPKAQPPIFRALRTREQISLGLLIEALFEELTACLGPDEEFPDIEALTQFLTMLHTGMNVNPRLTLVRLGMSMSSHIDAANYFPGSDGLRRHISANSGSPTVQYISHPSDTWMACIVVRPGAYCHVPDGAISRRYPIIAFPQTRARRSCYGRTVTLAG